MLGIAFLTATLVLRDTVTAGFATTFTAANSGTDAVVRNADGLGAADEPRAPIDASLQSRIDALDGVAATAAFCVWTRPDPRFRRHTDRRERSADARRELDHRAGR